MIRRVPSRVFLPLILMTEALVALPRLPSPWLTWDSADVLDITCNIQNLESSHYQQGTEVQLQLKFQANGSLENMTLVEVTSKDWKVNKGLILDPLASVDLLTFESERQPGFALTGLHLVTPFSELIVGAYFLDVHRINETNGSQVVFSYSIHNISCTAGESTHSFNAVFTVRSFPVHKLNITWVPPPDSKPTKVNIERVWSDLSGNPMPFPPPVTWSYEMVNQTNKPNTREVLLVQQFKPRPCGVKNYTLVIFVKSSIPCVPSCNYKCQVKYPECEEGHDRGRYCECGAPPPPGDWETEVAPNKSTDCDDNTNTEPAEHSISVATSGQPPAHSTTPHSSKYETNIVPNTTHSPLTQSSEIGEISTSKTESEPFFSVDNSSQCFGQCTAFRAVVIIMSAFAGIVFLIAILIVVRKCRKFRRRNSQESTGQTEAPHDSAGAHPLINKLCGCGLADSRDADISSTTHFSIPAKLIGARYVQR